MPDDISDIRDFYSRSTEYEDNRLIRHQLEFEMTMRYLDAYLPEEANILELGAATGRYTLQLVKRGHQVTAVDLSPVLLAQCEKRLQTSGLQNWETLVADARDLGNISGRFDVVLIMGPFYHLVEYEDRKQVLENAYERLNDSGLCFTAWVSRLGMLGSLIRNMPEWIQIEDEVGSIMKDGRDPPGPRAGFRGYFARAEEIQPFHEAAGFETQAFAGVEPCIGSHDESFNALEGPLRTKWLDLLFQVSQEPSIIGASGHLLYIGRKAV
ncbi:MAG: class I SAM-dependent methyltransferase [Pseudomonadota bacterium]